MIDRQRHPGAFVEKILRADRPLDLIALVPATQSCGRVIDSNLGLVAELDVLTVRRTTDAERKTTPCNS
jgi:hypothetical protein